jgi:hypothetical protein
MSRRRLLDSDGALPGITAPSEPVSICSRPSSANCVFHRNADESLIPRFCGPGSRLDTVRIGDDAGKLHRLQSGEMILMPAQQPHALKAMQPFKMILTMIRS